MMPVKLKCAAVQLHTSLTCLCHYAGVPSDYGLCQRAASEGLQLAQDIKDDCYYAAAADSCSQCTFKAL
jgi:hypothetical protein